MAKPPRAAAPGHQPPGPEPETPPIDLAAELAKLDPEQADLFVRALELTMRKRRVMFFGYLVALLAVVVGQILALLVWANREPGHFVGWIFLVPLALAGGVLTVTPRLVKRVKPRP